MRTARRRPLLFLGLTLGCSVPFYALNGLKAPAPSGFPPSVAMILVPAAVAGVLVARECGKRGLRSWLRSVVDLRRAGPRWLGVAVLFPSLLQLLAWAVHPSGSGWPLSFWQAVLVFAVYWLGAVPEELGWTGYATAPLQQRWGVARAGALIGVVWAGWHVIPYLSMGHSWSWIGWQCSMTIAARVVMGYLFAFSEGALSPAVLFHAALNAALDVVPGAEDPQRMRILALAMIGTATALVVVGKSPRWRPDRGTVPHVRHRSAPPGSETAANPSTAGRWPWRSRRRG